jgi:hypothetical protein
MYAARRPAAAEIAGMYIKAWEQKHFASKPKADLKTELYPAICFSRKIGVGALEIADILAKKIGSRVADKLIIEEMANNSSVKKETVDFFDERYPGRVAELATLLFGEKSFIMSNYMHGLMGVLYALAMSEPTIFVGRAAYLLLPRDRALSVRFICSKPYRAKRIAKIMKISANEAEKKLQELDKEQSDFFKKLAGKKEPVPEDFDLLINCDVISRPEWAADIVAAAFRSKFGV